MIQNWIAINADVVVAPSTPIIDHAKQVGIKNIFYLPNGVDTSVFNPRKYHESQGRDLRQKYNVRDNEKLAVYMGRLDEWAGTRLILKCAEKLKNQPVKFLLVGEGQCEPASKTSNVVFSGPIHYDLVPEYLAAADLVLVPMKPDVLGNASSPIKLFEAMAMMKPIVASDTTGISDVAKNYQDGILVPFDENAWAHAILHILKNPSMASKLGMNTRKKAEAMFDWNILASKLQQLLIQLSKSSHKKNADFQSN
jgi:glycosyltransferase involved in cell wall biosynthesis